METMPSVEGQEWICGWGRLGVAGREVPADDLRHGAPSAMLCRGLGRSYGDASLPAPDAREVLGTRLADRILAFDPETGVLRAESGVTLQKVKELFLPRGWFTPVSPGTQYVTLGGMAAADVHGKNHHGDGCIEEHIRRLTLRVADGRIIECSRRHEAELFFATLGGMGLTGQILDVELQLAPIPSPWIECECRRTPNLSQMVLGLQESRREWPFAVGWMDCLRSGPEKARGILIRGRWVNRDVAPASCPRTPRRLSVPCVFPGWILNRWSMRRFNDLYYWRRLPKQTIVGPDPFFYPLDGILNWNRIYGPNGFVQYQCVLPDSAPDGAVHRFLKRVNELSAPAYLCIIKDFGPEGQGVLSFPRPGMSLAIDMPMRGNTQRIIDALNEFVIAEQGRINLAKDALTRAEHFRKMEPRLERFQEIRHRYDPQRRFKSALSARLLGDDG